MPVELSLVILGWFGTFLYLTNHAYISLVKSWKLKLYYSGNFIAAVSLVISSFYINSWQAVFINLFWALISLAMVVKWPLSKLGFEPKWFYRAFWGFVLAFIGISLWHGAPSFAVMGWSSVLVFSAAYLLFSANVITQREYMLWNAYAAFILLPALFLDGNTPVLALEVVWGIISLYGTLKQDKNPHLLD